jgi:hypothetical protein
MESQIGSSPLREIKLFGRVQARKEEVKAQVRWLSWSSNNSIAAVVMEEGDITQIHTIRIRQQESTSIGG